MKLSFCIPTYNFGAYLGDTLESILAQATEEVEIVIVDGGSTDNTDNVVETFCARFPRITYFKRTENCGVDRDIAKAIELSKGTFFWLMSADDALAPGAIDRMMAYLDNADADVWLASWTACNYKMQPKEYCNVYNPKRSSGLLDLGVANQRERFLAQATSVVALFSYCSSVIVRRSAWDKLPWPEAFAGTCYAHVQHILALSRTGLRVRWLAEPLVLYRGDNDSILARFGTLRRLLLDIDGYNRIADETFGHDSREAFYIRRLLERSIRLRRVMALKADMVERNDIAGLQSLDKAVKRLFRGTGSLRGLFFLAIYRTMPFGLYTILANCRRRLLFGATH